MRWAWRLGRKQQRKGQTMALGADCAQRRASCSVLLDQFSTAAAGETPAGHHGGRSRSWGVVLVMCEAAVWIQCQPHHTCHSLGGVYAAPRQQSCCKCTRGRGLPSRRVSWGTEPMQSVQSDSLQVERYSKLIRVVCDALYSRHTGEILRTDRQLYNALIYIVGVKMPLVELKQQQPSDLKEDNEEEHSGLTARSKTACPGPQLGVEQLSYWALAQRADFQLKVQRLIEFLYVEGLAEPDLPSTNQDALKVAVDAGVAAAPPAQTLIRRWWCELYDPEYVDHKIIAGMKRCQPAIMKLLHDIEVQRGAGEAKQGGAGVGAVLVCLTVCAANKTAAVVSKRRRSSKQKTVPKPFNLTTPKPRVCCQASLLLVGQTLTAW